MLPRQPGASRGLTGARDGGHKARELLRQGLDPIGDRVVETVQRVRQRLDSVFEDAIFHKRCTSNPPNAVRRKMRETMPKKKAGPFASLPYKEAPALMARLRGAPGTAARCLEFAEQSNMAMLAALDRLGVRDRTTVHGLCRATFSLCSGTCR